ncbi:hypothetical protein DFH28DRAFT_1196515 [Melampsora americana]|nr:hypothetical protein DFH28DRAFT_1196515 [Melampsora americana]
MSPTINKVIYKPNSTSGKEGDKSIPLVEIVDAFDVFHSGQSAQGLLNRPSKQELETVFGTSNDTEVIKIGLEKGRLESSDGQPLKFSSKNDNRGGSNLISPFPSLASSRCFCF